MFYTQHILRRYCSIKASAEEIASELTLKSCEVEEIHTRTIPDLVVIGKVLEVSPHPDADKLVICQLDCGNKGTYQICTGASNVVAGHYVPVALPGAHLPAIDLTIAPRQMRGQDSHGMICSKEELGIADDLGLHSIWTLQGTNKRTAAGYHDDVTAGTFDDITDEDAGIPLSEKYPWLDSWTIDVENKTITHRPDMFGHLGLAFELQTIFSDAVTFSATKVAHEKLTPGHILQLLEHATPHSIETAVVSPLVHTYCTMLLENITVQPSDFYTKIQLLDCGLESRNNWVDFSNLFMLTTGQPVHFFDAKKITGTVTVRQAKEGEQFTDLFDQTHQLIEADIVIADDEKILALAGIVGSNTSGIETATTDILVEIANFDPVAIRKTAMRLGLRTDAQIRFEKSINPLYSLGAVELFLDELAYMKPCVGPCKVVGTQSWINPESNVHITESVAIDWDYIYSMIYGIPKAPTHFVEQSSTDLTGLGFTVRGEMLSVPARRAPEDITKTEDIVEEIARIIGFNEIEEKALGNNSGFIEHLPSVTANRAIEEWISNTYKAQQIETYPRLDKKRLSMVDAETTTLFRLKNPLNPEQSNLRNTMIRSLLEAVQKNAPFFDDYMLFDRGKIWNKQREQAEHEALCIAWYVTNQDDLNHPIRQAKECVQKICALVGAKGKLMYLPTENSKFHPKQQALITLNRNDIGTVQTIHPSILASAKIETKAIVSILELDLTVLKTLIPEKKSTRYTYESLTDQIIWRDLNFVLDKEQPFGSITDALLKVKEIDDVALFDLYQGENLPENSKSCAVRIKIPGDGSLTTEQINAIMDKAISSVESAGGSLRS